MRPGLVGYCYHTSALHSLCDYHHHERLSGMVKIFSSNKDLGWILDDFLAHYLPTMAACLLAGC